MECHGDDIRSGCPSPKVPAKLLKLVELLDMLLVSFLQVPKLPEHREP